MKAFKLFISILVMGVIFSIVFNSCKEDDPEVIIEVEGCMDATAVNYNPDANKEDGSCILPSQLEDVTRTYYKASTHAADDTKAPWFDKVHSNIHYENDYHDYGFAVQTGRFGNFDGSIVFNEAQPSLTAIDAWVQLSTINTTEPGRDEPGGCGPRYHGVDFYTHTEIMGPDTITVYDSVMTSTDTAWLTTSGGEFHFVTNKRGFTTSYKTTGTLTYRGQTSTVDVFFDFNGIDTEVGRTGFQGYFNFNCISDHGVTSTSAADETLVRFSMQMRGL